MSNRDAQEFSGREAMNRDEESLENLPDRQSTDRNSVYKLAGGDRNDEGLSDLPDRQSIKDNSVYKLAQEAREKFGSGNSNDNPASSGYSARHPDENNIGHKASKLEEYEDRMNNVVSNDNSRSSGAGGSAMSGNTNRNLNSSGDTSRSSTANTGNRGNIGSASSSNTGDSQSGYQSDPNYSRQNNASNPHPVSQGGKDEDATSRLSGQGAPTAYPDQRGYRNDPVSTEDKENSLPETVTLSTEPFEGRSKLDGTSSEEWDATGDEQNNQPGQQRGGKTPYQNQSGSQTSNPRYQTNNPTADSQSGTGSDDLQRGIKAGPDVMPPGGRSGFESGSASVNNNAQSGSGGQSDNLQRGIKAGAEAMPPGGRSGFESGSASSNSQGGSGGQSDNLQRGINAGAEAMPAGGTSGFDSSSRVPQTGKELFDSPSRNNQPHDVQAYDSHVQRRPDTTIREDKDLSNQRADMMDTTIREDKDLTRMSGGNAAQNMGSTSMAASQTRQPGGTIRPATKSTAAPSINDSHYDTNPTNYTVDNRSNSLDGDDQGYNRTQGGTTEQHHPGSRDRA